MITYLIVGLGNPEPIYSMTRHNTGFIMLDYFSNAASGPWKSGFSSQYKQTSSHPKVIFLKPLLYMNNSGFAVQKITHFFKVKLSNVLVIHDDMDIPLGKIKIKIGGGSGGHNGLNSIDQMIGKDYWRLRVGIGKPDDKRMINKHVLGKFNLQEQCLLDKMIEKLNNNITNLIVDPIYFRTQVLHSININR